VSGEIRATAVFNITTEIAAFLLKTETRGIYIAQYLRESNPER
jgi:hypothetical protein